MSSVFVRIGVLAEIRRASAAQRHDPGTRVVVRTERGLEVGEVVGACQDRQMEHRVTVIRKVTDQDELLIQRLARDKRSAVEKCRQALQQSGSQAVLLDIEQLFDGTTLILHFLGEPDELAKSVVGELASEYESVVKTVELTKSLVQGCGPECGTSNAAGCGSSCAGCAVASACKTVST